MSHSRRERARLLWRLPVFLCIALIALPAFLVYGNTFHTLVAGLPMYSDTALHGVELPAPEPRLTWASFWSGVLARRTASFFGQKFPLLGPAVRIKGQIYWSALDQSPAWYITIGRDRTLFETAYIDEYCSRDIAGFAPIARSWASRLAEMQRWYAARNKIFIYLLTPSKASVEPEEIPDDWPCLASAADRLGFHAAYMRILKEAGVNVADTVMSTLRAKRDYPFPPFPPFGTHFNAVSSALATQVLIAATNGASTWRRMDDFSFTWRMGAPDEVDDDLLQALNVPWPGPQERAPSVYIQPTSPRACRPVIIGEVGGSFLYQINRIMQRLPCPPNVDLYEYFKNTMAFYPGDRRYPVDRRRRAWMLLDAADVVVLEENEELAARSQHGVAFYQFVSDHLGRSIRSGR